MNELEKLRADIEVTNLLLIAVMGSLDPKILRIAVQRVKELHDDGAIYTTLTDSQIAYASLRIQRLLDGLPTA